MYGWALYVSPQLLLRNFFCSQKKLSMKSTPKMDTKEDWRHIPVGQFISLQDFIWKTSGFHARCFKTWIFERKHSGVLHSCNKNGLLKSRFFTGEKAPRVPTKLGRDPPLASTKAGPLSSEPCCSGIGPSLGPRGGFRGKGHSDTQASLCTLEIFWRWQ